MGQNKLVRFEAIKGFSNVLQNPPGMQGQWHKQFGNRNPITLELACGKGEYTVGLSALYPERNFVGVDVKGNRLYVGAKQCIAANRHNAAFLRTKIDQIADYFGEGEISEIWITFPDPQLRRSHAKKRLTHPKFLRLYQQFLVPGGLIHLKTDSPVLYRFTLMVIEMYKLELVTKTDNLYAKPDISPELQIKTHYEALDIAGSNRIHYITFKLPATQLVNLDKELQELVFQYEEATH
ncbi:tRNA (guanosine(46)-N7)-methyltransferase TrmB [Flavihumibacter profundi]|uniref:tRNA (guanosine(46)-N7)-methyltransferase TrmB n=1 Tax=Flavihumibacter profundi TaxID=2716883 RepID=UPI001CC570F1|nr:tRNA (guanosine(46)-N7)-methyltransferase TrmB [Flavihumibacter profundi]MBZ5858957.1 tRNA (guanosine(46)-N7)-methyltransferase TrmB [Flavihumibacter profundi]